MSTENECKYLKNVQTQELQHHVNGAKQELDDLLDLYLDQDIAGDNQDRRNKIKAFKFIKGMLKDYKKSLKHTTENAVKTKHLQKQLINYLFNYDKQTILSTFKDMESLYELYLNTDMADNFTLRQRIANSVLRIKELKGIIKAFAPSEIHEETLKFVCHG